MTETRVCEEQYPSRNGKKPGFLMETALKQNLDILLMNIQDDWDFTIIISGTGQVRVGKSLLGAQIAAYVADVMSRKYKTNATFTLARNYAFRGLELIEKGHFLGTNNMFSPLVYDEAGADLEGKKVLRTTTTQVLDYYRECGQYNLFNILVMPEFFDVPRGVALSRSIFLLNVYYTANKDGKFQRGYFNFYSRPKKKRLFLRGKKDLNYGAATYDFHGRFYKFYPFDEQEYRELKRKALLRRDEQDTTDLAKRRTFQLGSCMMKLMEYGMEQHEIGKMIGVEQSTVSITIRKAKKMISDRKKLI